MPSSSRLKDSGGGTKVPLVPPMSERQQMALLMQLTSTSDTLPKSPGGTRHKDRNERGETSLHLAAIKGDVEQVAKLLNQKADPNATDFAGWTPLHEACNYGWYEIAYRLVNAGANVNAKGLDNDTPLHDAVINCHIKLVKLLVENGADIYAKNTKGKAPMDVATPEVAQYLLNPNLPHNESVVPSRVQSRTRDDKKITESKQKSTPDDAMESKTSSAEDIYEFKPTKESSPEQRTSTSTDQQSDSLNTSTSDESTNKRNISEVAESGEENTNDEECRKKKRKDDGGKDTKGNQRGAAQGKGQCSKQTGSGQTKGGTSGASKGGSADKKSPCSSPKITSDAEDDSKSDLKVPPLKIVIPQTTSNEQESGTNRNGKNTSQRSHQALPYVVPSSSGNDANEKDAASTSASEESSGTKTEEKKDSSTTSISEDVKNVAGGHQRVLRSSLRGGSSQVTDRSSNNSSPQLQRSYSPSPSASPGAAVANDSQPISNSSSNTTSKISDTQATSETEISTISTSTTSATSSSTSSAPPVELHPRKRKMKQSKEPPMPPPEPAEAPSDPQIHPHDQPITNCYQLFLDIRKQIEKRRKGLFPVQPKPPQGFKDYLMNRCTYVLAGTAPTTPNITYPGNLATQMKDLFTEQEKERYRLRMQHVIEKEKLVLSVEQEILRVHGRAARALANQSLPFSVCTILRDEEVYNLITPEQEEKDRNARSRYNGRLFLSWLQDVDDKWEKIKEHMLLRHHNEAESLHAVQKMDWEWKMKEFSLCDRKSTPTIDDHHVPMVHVSDDFDLLPA